MNKIVALLLIVVIIFGVIFGLVSYSYSQIGISINDVSSVEIKLETLQLSDLIQLSLDVLAGNWISMALSVISEINIGMVFELSNGGFFPVYLPDVSYDLSINDIQIGRGYSEIDAIINPGESKEIEVFQNLQKNIFDHAINSIIEDEGIVNVHINGTAFFELFGQKIPIPFESTKEFSIIEELQARISQEMQN